MKKNKIIFNFYGGKKNLSTILREINRRKAKDKNSEETKNYENAMKS